MCSLWVPSLAAVGCSAYQILHSHLSQHDEVNFINFNITFDGLSFLLSICACNVALELLCFLPTYSRKQLSALFPIIWYYLCFVRLLLHFVRKFAYCWECFTTHCFPLF